MPLRVVSNPITPSQTPGLLGSAPENSLSIPRVTRVRWLLRSAPENSLSIPRVTRVRWESSRTGRKGPVSAPGLLRSAPDSKGPILLRSAPDSKGPILLRSFCRGSGLRSSCHSVSSRTGPKGAVRTQQQDWTQGSGQYSPDGNSAAL